LQYLEPKKIVLIGASTGGPGQIKKIIQALPSLHHCSIIIAQHMSDGFLESFVSNLNKDTTNTIKMADSEKILLENTIYVCEKSITIEQTSNNVYFKKQLHVANSFNPNINLIFNSFLQLSQNVEILSVILTGIGDDGIQACVKLSENGTRCITETNQSAIIDGIPSRARELVTNIEAYDIEEIIKIICEFVSNV